MNPETSIPPMRAVRRANAKRLHLTDTVKREDLQRIVGNARNYEPTMCGQSIPAIKTKVLTVYNAAQVTCY